MKNRWEARYGNYVIAGAFTRRGCEISVWIWLHSKKNAVRRARRGNVLVQRVGAFAMAA